MREILFRGKRLDNGEWVEGCLAIANDRINNGKCYILPCLSDFSWGDRGNRIRVGNFVEVCPNTVGQYTTMIDQNDSRIFEGDIVQDMKGTIYSVVWGGAGFCLRYDPPRSHGHYCELLPLNNYWSAHGAIIVVIGNIHDNPELLKGE